MKTASRIIGLLIISCSLTSLSGCALAGPIAEPSILKRAIGVVVNQINYKDCEERHENCTTEAIQKREAQEQELRDEKQVAKGELIPVDGLAEESGKEPESSVLQVPEESVTDRKTVTPTVDESQVERSD